MGQATFDPGPHVQRVIADGQEIDYLDVRWRLIWLRREHPDAQITTEHVQVTPDLVIFRAMVTIPAGGAASGYGSAVPADGPRYVEKAETRALGRALLALGLGTDLAPDFTLVDDVGQPVAGQPAAVQPATGLPTLPAGVTVGPNGSRVLPPRLAAAMASATPIVDHEPPAADPAPAAAASDAPAAPAASAPEAAMAPRAGVPEAGPVPAAEAEPLGAPEPAETQPARGPRPGRPVTRVGRAIMASATGGGPRREAGEQPPVPTLEASEERPTVAARPTVTATERPARPAISAVPRQAVEPVAEDDEADRAADTDWTSFWRWARGRGFDNRDAIERAIGQPIRGRTPKELRTLLMNLDAEPGE